MGLAATLTVLLLTGCSNNDIAWRANESDVVGTWIADVQGVDSAAKLIVEVDGTFVATDWPQNLSCVARQVTGRGSPNNIGAVEWNDTVTVHGSWSLEKPNMILLLSTEGHCSDGPQLWNSFLGEQEFALRFYLDGFDDEWNFVTFKKALR